MTTFEAFLSCKSVSTDTRNIINGSVFFALKGARFNGNEFAAEALKQGAHFAVVDEPVGNDPRFIYVDSVLEALQDCARAYRKHLGVQVVGLTGSNGKTTNKELFHAVLSKAYKTHSTPGNFNNHIGVPLTLLAIPEDSVFAIVEMGANHQKEIALLASIAEPNIGYITNYGKAHMEGFGGVEGIIKGKSELYDYCRENNRRVMINFDDPIQLEKSANIERFGYGLERGMIWKSVSRGEFAAIEFESDKRIFTIQSKLSGSFNEQNIAAAVCLGLELGVEPSDIVRAVEDYTPDMNRVEWRYTQHNKVLLDAYNANPTSMSLSVESFAKWHSDGWMILGDMFELGDASKIEHEAIIQQVHSLKMEKRTIVVGEHFQQSSWKGLSFRTVEDLVDYWNKKGAPKDAHILLKGSRGIALERLLESL